MTPGAKGRCWLAALSLATWLTHDYHYAHLDQLTQEKSVLQNPAAGDPWNAGYQFGFGWDNVGNPTTFRSGAMSLLTRDSQLTGAGMSFDGNGNPTTYTGSSASFDVENHLTGLNDLI